MASQSKSDSARANGSKSKGPVTPEGKARSSQNARKHGLCASFRTLPAEEQHGFDELLHAHEDLFQPEGAVECDLVRTLAILRWRLRRIPDIETAMLDTEISLADDEINDRFASIDDIGRLGFVFRQLSDQSQILQLLIRYESSLTRVYDRTFKHLQKLRNEPNRGGARTPACRVETPLDASPNPIASPGTAIRQHGDRPSPIIPIGEAAQSARLHGNPPAALCRTDYIPPSSPQMYLLKNS